MFAAVDPKKRAKGVTAFLVEKDTPGFAVGKKEKKMGIRASPVEQRLGAEGDGFTIAMQTLDITRPATGAMAVGIGQAALDAAVGYAKEPTQRVGSPRLGARGRGAGGPRRDPLISSPGLATGEARSCRYSSSPP